MPAIKPEKKLYQNAVQAYGGAMLTVGDLLDLIKRDKIPRTAILVGSADEEGNRFGYIYEMMSDTLAVQDAKDMYIEKLAGKRIITLMPAI